MLSPERSVIMSSDSTPPPYDRTNPELAPDEKPSVAESAARERVAEPSDESTDRQEGPATDEQPQVVLYVAINKNKRTKEQIKTGKYVSSRDAFMLSPSAEYEDTLHFLQQRIFKHDHMLQIPKGSIVEASLWYSVQESNKDPWLDSNWHNNIRIEDEVTWKACKTWLAKIEKAILMMLVVVPSEEGSDGSGEDKGDDRATNMKEKKKRCVVQ